MSGKLYIGSPNGIVTRIKEVYAGDSNGVGHIAKGVFVGDSANRACKIWPQSQLPIGYDEVEYFKFLDDSTYFETDIYILKPIDNFYYQAAYRIVMSFSFPNGINTTSGSILNAKSGSGGSYNYFDIDLLDTKTFYFLYGWSGWDYAAIESNRTEQILPNVRYHVDFNEKSLMNGTAANSFYLYTPEGFYSIPEHNRLGYFNINTYRFNGNYNKELILFGEYQYSGNSSLLKAKTPFPMIFYECRIYYNPYSQDTDSVENYLVRDFRPCVRKRDNAIGLFDIVDQLFFTSGHYVNDGSIELGPYI